MRITGGAARGRSLRVPRGSKIRPTADKVRAAIFNILANRTDLVGRTWLDLFAGTGALGLEALSRGAAAVVFVDQSAESCRVVRQNVERSGFVERADVRRLTLPEGLRRLETGFAGAFVDPPYSRGLAEATLRALAEVDVVGADGWVVVEHAAREVFAERYGNLRRVDSRRYGSTGLSLYVMEAA
jgi:16S rRNA (guanine966-N2)-methyltransferase